MRPTLLRSLGARSSAPLAGVGLLALALALVSCGDTRLCKSGTLFISVELQGDALGADQLVIDVQPDGEAARHSAFPHAAGTAQGSIEVDFPGGYQAGRHVQIVLTAQKSGAPIGTVTGSVMLATGCSTLDLRIAGSAADGGNGDAAADLGHGDAAADAPRGTGGSGGGTGAGGGTGGGSGTGGTGGTGGGPATGGAGGGTDAGNETGADGGCVFQSAEDCFNGIDDDCNGHIDCDDPACTQRTTCVPAVGANGFVTGVWVDPATPCPVGFEGGESVINSALDPGVGCTGCSCNAPITCSANLYKYGSALACTADALTLNNGALAGSVSATLAGGATSPTTTCLASTFTTTTEARIGPYVPSGGVCSPKGTPALSTATWGKSRKFCSAAGIGGGCSPGYVCAPRTAPNHCVLAIGPQTCPAGYTQDGGPWYTGFSDRRSCSPCTCGPQTAGSCAPLQVAFYFGSTTTCTAGIHRGGGSNTNVCNFGGDCASAGFTGTPTAPTCPPVTTVSGALTPAGEQTLCCF
jgi:hypothetical protein